MTMSNKKGSWKSKTNKLVKTLNNQGCNPHSNIMTEDDIDKLFGKPKVTESALAQTKVSTENVESWGYDNVRNFTNSVKFLRM
jgi:hypothetical protein